MRNDWSDFNNRVQRDDSGSILNLIQLDGVPSSNLKAIGLKLNEINENERSNDEYEKIGVLYNFNILVKTEASMKDGFDFKENRFFVEGEGGIKYTYNNGHIAKDPKLAAANFIKALERIPALIDSHKRYAEKAAKDVPILEEVVKSNWRKEDELRKFKSELSAVDRKIQLSLSDNQVGRKEEEMVGIDEKNKIENNSVVSPIAKQKMKVG